MCFYFAGLIVICFVYLIGSVLINLLYDLVHDHPFLGFFLVWAVVFGCVIVSAFVSCFFLR